VTFAKAASEIVKRAITIAIRYNCVRLVSQIPSTKKVASILDFQMQQASLLPILATTYAVHFGAVALNERYQGLIAKLTSNQSNESTIGLLARIHAEAAGLKSWTTDWATAALETSRASLGGHGFAHYAGIASLLVRTNLKSLFGCREISP